MPRHCDNLSIVARQSAAAEDRDVIVPDMPAVLESLPG